MKITSNDVVWRAHVCGRAQKKKKSNRVFVCDHMSIYAFVCYQCIALSSYVFIFFFHFLLGTVPNTDWPITHSLWFQKVLLAFNKCQRKKETVFISRRVFIWDRHKTLIIPMAQCTDKRLTLWFCAEKVALLIDRRLTLGLTFFLFFFFSLRLRNQMITSEIRE